MCDHLVSKSSGTLPRVMNERYAGEHHRNYNTCDRVGNVPFVLCERAKVKVRERYDVAPSPQLALLQGYFTYYP